MECQVENDFSLQMGWFYQIKYIIFFSSYYWLLIWQFLLIYETTTCIHHAPNSYSKFDHYIERVGIVSMGLMAYFCHFGWLDCVNGVNQSFLVGGYNNTCPSCNQMEIQNLTVGLVECVEIFVFANDSDNQTVRL